MDICIIVDCCLCLVESVCFWKIPRNRLAGCA